MGKRNKGVMGINIIHISLNNSKSLNGLLDILVTNIKHFLENKVVCVKIGWVLLLGR